MRAFVLFGKFLWPPVATLTQEDQSEERWREGAVEVHLWEDFEAGLASVAFRWRPRALLNSLKPAGEVKFDWPKDSLFSLSLTDAQKRFADLPEDSELAFLIDRGDFEHKVKSGTVIPPFLTGCIRRIHAAIFSFWAGVMPPMPMLGRSLL